MKIVFIVNNKNNRLKKVLPGLEAFWREKAIGEVQFVFTDRTKHAIELAIDATEKGCDYLVAVGGDGTLNELVNGVLSSNVSADAYPTLGLLPYGSANDFARTAGVSNSMEELYDLIQANSAQKIDLGKVVLHESQQIHYFINIVGIGLGPEVVKSLEGTSSILGPGFNYFRHIIKGFLRYRKKEVSCSGGKWQWKGKLLQMAIANGRYFGNAICIAPDALVDDGSFQVSIFGDLSVWNYLKNLGKLKRGEKIDHPEVSYFEANEVLLESSDACGIEADGEYVGLAPAKISVMPKAISFLMPPKS